MAYRARNIQQPRAPLISHSEEGFHWKLIFCRESPLHEGTFPGSGRPLTLVFDGVKEIGNLLGVGVILRQRLFLHWPCGILRGGRGFLVYVNWRSRSEPCSHFYLGSIGQSGRGLISVAVSSFDYCSCYSIVSREYHFSRLRFTVSPRWAGKLEEPARQAGSVSDCFKFCDDSGV